MALPQTIRVKLSSEAAGDISVTQVVVQEMPLGELVGLMLGSIGKDAGRVRDILRRGSLVSGASRFRWEGWEADLESVEALLTTFPDHEPGRAFAPERCVRAVLRGPHARIELPRTVIHEHYWKLLIELAATPRYLEYSYRDRADLYRLALSPQAVAELQTRASLLKHASLRGQIRAASFDTIELVVKR